jgi:ribosomal-protein-alanine N-acetyltransferase
MEHIEIVETERLTLRRFCESDLEEMHKVLSNPEVMKFSLNGPYSREKSADFIRGCLEGYEKRGVGLFAVILRDEQRVIGYCGFYFLSVDGTDEVEIGYRLHPSFWGQGLATEAAVAVKNLGFNRLGFDRLISCIEEANLASIRVAEKAGMKHENNAIFRDKIPVRIYALSKPKIAEPVRPANALTRAADGCRSAN